MSVYDLIREISSAEMYDKVEVTDGNNTYDIDYVHTDNGFVQIFIKKEKEND